jgi:hypothetical protein
MEHKLLWALGIWNSAGHVFPLADKVTLQHTHQQREQQQQQQRQHMKGEQAVEVG